MRTVAFPHLERRRSAYYIKVEVRGQQSEPHAAELRSKGAMQWQRVGWGGGGEVRRCGSPAAVLGLKGLHSGNAWVDATMGTDSGQWRGTRAEKLLPEAATQHTGRFSRGPATLQSDGRRY